MSRLVHEAPCPVLVLMRSAQHDAEGAAEPVSRLAA